MGLFDIFNKKSPDSNPESIDAGLREKLVNLVLDTLRDPDGRIRVEDAISASATIVGERCIDVAGDFSLRDHDLAPGSAVFSTRANELICGDLPNAGFYQIPKDSIFGLLRSRLDPKSYSDSDFPKPADVFSQYAAGIGNPENWGRVPLSAPKDNLPLIPPLRFGFETRNRADEIFSPLKEDRARCLRIATESLADILNMVSTAISRKTALLIATETINGMTKTASMTQKAMLKVKEGN